MPNYNLQAESIVEIVDYCEVISETDECFVWTCLFANTDTDILF